MSAAKQPPAGHVIAAFVVGACIALSVVVTALSWALFCLVLAAYNVVGRLF